MSTPSIPFQFLSEQSANAIISDLRPTSIAPQALQHINLLLSEILYTLVHTAQSINPTHLRLNGIPAVFGGNQPGESTGTKSLGRSAVGEAEVELRSWYETQKGVRSGFGKDGQGRGLTSTKERSKAAFPEGEAMELLRIKCASFSTIASTDSISPQQQENALAAWQGAGGDPSDLTTDPAGLWLTAILEHISERILTLVGRVVARDSSAAVATLVDLYTALCEDEAVYGFFKRFRVKNALEKAISSSGSRSNRGTPNRTSPNNTKTAGRLSPLSGSPHASKVSLIGGGTPAQDTSIDSSRHKTSTPPVSYGPEAGIGSSRGSYESSRLAGVTRKASSMSRKLGVLGRESHERNSSVLSANTRSMVRAHNDKVDEGEEEGGRSPQEDEADFDALIASDNTMKVSLTPSRLKTFESPGRRSQPEPPQQTSLNRRPRGSSTGGNAVPPLPSSMPIMPKTETSAYSDLSRSTPPPARSRSNSIQQKFIARGPMTIDERADEEDKMSVAERKSQKQSWMELLNTEARRDAEIASHNSDLPKRTAPAVVLGTLPLPAARARVVATAPAASAPLTAVVGAGGMDRQPSQIQLQQPSVNRPNRVTAIDDDDGLDVAPVWTKRKSDAQELADFLNTTPPPHVVQRKMVEPPKNAKGLRGFMSKMTGGKKKDEKPQEPLDAIPTAPSPILLPKSQQSSLSASPSMQSIPRSIHSAHPSLSSRHYRIKKEDAVEEDAPPVPAKLLRKRSNGKEIEGAVTEAVAAPLTAGLAGAVLEDQTGPGRQSSSPLPSTTSAVEAWSTRSPRKAVPMPTRITSFDEYAGKRIEDEFIRSTTPKVDPAKEARSHLHGAEIDSTSGVKQVPEGDHSSATKAFIDSVPETDDKKLLLAATAPSVDLAPGQTDGSVDKTIASASNSDSSLATSSRTGQAERTQTLQSEAASFMTAKENLEEPQGPIEESSTTDDQRTERGDNKRDDNITEMQTIAGQSADSAKSVASVKAGHTERAVPSIPLADLVPLRGLLKHATTANECRMLLSAILTQLLVPVSTHAEPTVTPEARVVAWLLAGREGPPYSPQSATFSDLKMDDDYVMTPTVAHSAQREPPVSIEWRGATRQGTFAGAEVEKEDEVLSETTSNASLAKEEGEAERMVAQAGQRSSPVRVKQAGLGQGTGEVRGGEMIGSVDVPARQRIIEADI